MIQRGNSQFILACLTATASVLGCIAISLVTMSHAQVPTPRFYAQTAPVQSAQHACANGCASLVISQ